MAKTNKQTIKKKTKVVKQEKKPDNKSAYKATVIIMGRKSSAVGSSLVEVLDNLKVGRVKTKCILTLEYGGIKRERVLMPIMTYRIFNTLGFTREVALKGLSILYGIW